MTQFTIVVVTSNRYTSLSHMHTQFLSHSQTWVPPPHHPQWPPTITQVDITTDSTNQLEHPHNLRTSTLHQTISSSHCSSLEGLWSLKELCQWEWWYQDRSWHHQKTKVSLSFWFTTSEFVLMHIVCMLNATAFFSLTVCLLCVHSTCPCGVVTCDFIP